MRFGAAKGSGWLAAGSSSSSSSSSSSASSVTILAQAIFGHESGGMQSGAMQKEAGAQGWRQRWCARRCQQTAESEPLGSHPEAAEHDDPHIAQEQPQQEAAEQDPWEPPEDPHIAQEQPVPCCALCSWRRARIISDDTVPGQCQHISDGLHTDLGETWRPSSTQTPWVV